MRRIIVLSLLFISFAIEAKTMSLEEAKAFLANEEKHVSEDGEPPFRTIEDIDFLCYVMENWKQALSLLENDAPDLRRQSLIVVAAGFLPPQDDIRFANGICALIEAGKVDIKPWSWYGGFGEERDSFFAYYYNQPEVATVIERFEAIYKAKEPGKWDDYFLEIKSGERKKRLVEECTQYGVSFPEIYKVHSKEAHNRFVKLHEGLLAGKTMVDLLREEMGQKHPAPVTDKPDVIRIKLEDGSIITRLAESRDNKPEKTIAEQQSPVTTVKKNQPVIHKETPNHIATEHKQPPATPDKTVDPKTTPTKILLLIGVLAIIGIMLARRYFRKK